MPHERLGSLEARIRKIGEFWQEPAIGDVRMLY